MDEDDRLSSMESTSRPLCAPDLISLTVQVKWRELDKSGEGEGGVEWGVEWVAEISYVFIQLSLAIRPTFF